MKISILQVLGVLCFWGFIAVKLAGTSLATWSWWWMLMPIVPIFGLLVARLGL